MPVNSPYIGDWMGSVFSISGKRIDYHLRLDADGNYQRVVRQESINEHADRGRWHHEVGDDVLTIEPDVTGKADQATELWSVLSVKTCEDSNLLMVLRAVVLASRNLPVLFFRVHLDQ